MFKEMNEPLSDFLRPLAGKDERAALTLHLGDERPAVLLEAPGAREAETVHVEADRCVDIDHVEDGAGKPVDHITSPCVLNSTAILDARARLCLSFTTSPDKFR
jgi:hypothetical protein